MDTITMLNSPEYLSGSPNMEILIHNTNPSEERPDVLADVLHFMGLQGHNFARTRQSSPWTLEMPPDNMIHFYYIVRGGCSIKLASESQERMLNRGEMIVMTRGQAYCVYDNRTSEIMETDMLSGSFRCSPGREKLILPLLPTVMTLTCKLNETPETLDMILAFVIEESSLKLPGAKLVFARAAEILFVHVLRTWLDSANEKEAASWLGALKDTRIASALAALHGRPAHAWTVEELAECVGMSRSPFAARFSSMVGMSPMCYLKNLRMNIAAEYLENTGIATKEIAMVTGYDSEASLSKAFKSFCGMPPGEWRSTHGKKQLLSI